MNFTMESVPGKRELIWEERIGLDRGGFIPHGPVLKFATPGMLYFLIIFSNGVHPHMATSSWIYNTNEM
ncbi:hypothetical protein CMV_001157 [Castanea mollissima]|uniref:Uncharacterized protein n=1 Tax=Castanea mollissima TaxID=60419 RepID=A0A8J4RW60_9ROSI|nr:hypothetical protein CMV_001157 [Castanea mollissima]